MTVLLWNLSLLIILQNLAKEKLNVATSQAVLMRQQHLQHFKKLEEAHMMIQEESKAHYINYINKIKTHAKERLTLHKVAPHIIHLPIFSSPLSYNVSRLYNLLSSPFSLTPCSLFYMHTFTHTYIWQRPLGLFYY